MAEDVEQAPKDDLIGDVAVGMGRMTERPQDSAIVDIALAQIAMRITGDRDRHVRADDLADFPQNFMIAGAPFQILDVTCPMQKEEYPVDLVLMSLHGVHKLV